MVDDLCRLTADALSARLRDGEITAEQLARACLLRIAAREADVRAWSYVDPEAVIRQARELDKLPSRGAVCLLAGERRHQFLGVGQRFQPTNRRQCRVDAGVGPEPNRVARAIAKFRLELSICQRLARLVDRVAGFDGDRAAVAGREPKPDHPASSSFHTPPQPSLRSPSAMYRSSRMPMR